MITLFLGKAYCSKRNKKIQVYNQQPCTTLRLSFNDFMLYYFILLVFLKSMTFRKIMATPHRHEMPQNLL